jgi:hypothetical protein
MEENRIRDDRIVPSQEHRSAADIVMDPLGDIRPQIDEFKRGAEARVFLTPRALNTIQSYLPGQDLAYFRDPVNRLHIFRRGLIDVLQKLNITTFTREDVFAALRANQTDCLHYMLVTHPTMVRDHATTYTAEEILQQLRTGDPVGVLEYMNSLHPTMFEDADLQPVCYGHLLAGYRNRRRVINFLETFKLLNIRIGVMMPYSFVGIMAHPYYHVQNYGIREVIQIVINDNPSQIYRLVPQTMERLVAVYEIVSGAGGDRDPASPHLRELINTYVLPAYIFAPIVRNYFRDNLHDNYFNPFSDPHQMGTYIKYFNFFVELVVEGIPERVIPVLNSIPRELKHMTRYLIDFVDNADLRQRLMVHADDRDDISLGSGPDATRPGLRLSSVARSSAARSSAARSSAARSSLARSSAGFFSAPSSDAGFFSANSSDAGYFLFK